MIASSIMLKEHLAQHIHDHGHHHHHHHHEDHRMMEIESDIINVPPPSSVKPSEIIAGAVDDCPTLQQDAPLAALLGPLPDSRPETVHWQPGSPQYCPCWREIDNLVKSILENVKNNIVPETLADMQKGSKFFGAAVHSPEAPDYTTIVTSVNHEKMNPLNHAEIDAIRDFYTLPTSCRPNANETVFFATHAPCSYCLSGMVWNDFREAYVLLDYAATSSMGIAMDQEMIIDLFGTSYFNFDGKFLKGWYLADLVRNCVSNEKYEELQSLLDEVLNLYIGEEPGSVMSVFGEVSGKLYTPIGRRLQKVPQNIDATQVIPDPAEGTDPYCAHWLGSFTTEADTCGPETVGQHDVHGSNAYPKSGDTCN